MGDIPEHDPEEEGEGDDCEEGRVELLVVGRAVSVDDLLEPRGEFVGVEGGGGHEVESEMGAVDDVDLEVAFVHA